MSITSILESEVPVGRGEEEEEEEGEEEEVERSDEDEVGEDVNAVVGEIEGVSCNLPSVNEARKAIAYCCDI